MEVIFSLTRILLPASSKANRSSSASQTVTIFHHHLLLGAVVKPEGEQSEGVLEARAAERDILRTNPWRAGTHYMDTFAGFRPFVLCL